MRDGTQTQGRGAGARLAAARRYFLEGIWRDDGGGRWLRRLWMRVLRIGTMVYEGLQRTEGFVRAAALTYITVLSLVPFLALAFSVAKGLDAFDSFERDILNPFLDETFPVEQVASIDGQTSGTREAIEKVLGFVKETKFGALGTLGLLFMLLAAQRLMANIELAFNRIWGVRKARSWVRKLTDYTAIIVVTPILLIVATTVGSALQTERVQEWIARIPGLSLVGYVLPALALWVGFTFLYVCMPNTKVPFRSAFVGGIVAGSLWYVFQVAHVRFQVGVANYNAIYASFAAFPIFLFWLYSVFVIILAGALVAWAHDHEPMYSRLRRSRVESYADREIVAVRALRAVAAAFAKGEGLIREDDLAARCGLPLAQLKQVLDPIEDAQLIAHTNVPIPGWLPARPLEQIRLQDLFDALRGSRAKSLENGDDVAKIVDAVRKAAAATPANLTLSEIAPGR